MSEYSGFFNATAALTQDPDTGQTVKRYDRVYDAEDFANYFSTFITDGVFAKPSNQLRVVAKEALTVTVKAGKAYIKGYWYTLPEDMDLTFSPNSKGVAINNIVVCELSFTTRTITVHVEEDVSNTKRTENKLVLASFTLNPGISVITTAMITDRRPDKEYCGFVGQVLETIDYNELLEQNKAQFNEWFNEMKNQLSTDAAGSLQQQIDDLEAGLPTKLTDLENDLPISSVDNKGLVAKAGYHDDRYDMDTYYSGHSWGCNRSGVVGWVPDSRQMFQITKGGYVTSLEGHKRLIRYARFGAFISIGIQLAIDVSASDSQKSLYSAITYMPLICTDDLSSIGLLYGEPFGYDVGYQNNGYWCYAELPFYKYQDTPVRFLTLKFNYRFVMTVAQENNEKYVKVEIEFKNVTKQYESGYSDSVVGLAGYYVVGETIGVNLYNTYKDGQDNPE